MRLQNTASNSVTQLAIFSVLVSVSINQLLNSKHQGIHILKGATIKGKNILPLGSILFHLGQKKY